MSSRQVPLVVRTLGLRGRARSSGIVPSSGGGASPFGRTGGPLNVSEGKCSSSTSALHCSTTSAYASSSASASSSVYAFGSGSASPSSYSRASRNTSSSSSACPSSIQTNESNASGSSSTQAKTNTIGADDVLSSAPLEIDSDAGEMSGVHHFEKVSTIPRPPSDHTLQQDDKQSSDPCSPSGPTSRVKSRVPGVSRWENPKLLLGSTTTRRKSPLAIQAAEAALIRLAPDVYDPSNSISTSDLEGIFEGLFRVEHPNFMNLYDRSSQSSAKTNPGSVDREKAYLSAQAIRNASLTGKIGSEALSTSLRLLKRLQETRHPRTSTMYDSLLRHCVSHGDMRQAAAVFVGLVEEWISDGRVAKGGDLEQLDERNGLQKGAKEPKNDPSLRSASDYDVVPGPSAAVVNSWFEKVRDWRILGETLSPVDRLRLWHPEDLVTAEKMKNFPCPMPTSSPTLVPAPDHQLLTIILQSVCLDPKVSEALYISSARALAILANTILSRTLPITALRDTIKPFRDLPHEPPVFPEKFDARVFGDDVRAASPYTAYSHVHHALMSIIFSPPIRSGYIGSNYRLVPLSLAAIKLLAKYAVEIWNLPGLLTRILRAMKRGHGARNGNDIVASRLTQSILKTEVKSPSPLNNTTFFGKSRSSNGKRSLGLASTHRITPDPRGPHNEDIYQTYLSRSHYIHEEDANTGVPPKAKPSALDTLDLQEPVAIVAMIKRLRQKDHTGDLLVKYIYRLFPFLDVLNYPTLDPLAGPEDLQPELQRRQDIADDALQTSPRVFIAILQRLQIDVRYPEYERNAHLASRIYHLARRAESWSSLSPKPWYLPMETYANMLTLQANRIPGHSISFRKAEFDTGVGDFIEMLRKQRHPPSVLIADDARGKIEMIYRHAVASTREKTSLGNLRDRQAQFKKPYQLKRHENLDDLRRPPALTTEFILAYSRAVARYHYLNFEKVTSWEKQHWEHHIRRRIEPLSRLMDEVLASRVGRKILPEEFIEELRVLRMLKTSLTNRIDQIIGCIQACIEDDAEKEFQLANLSPEKKRAMVAHLTSTANTAVPLRGAPRPNVASDGSDRSTSAGTSARGYHCSARQSAQEKNGNGADQAKARVLKVVEARVAKYQQALAQQQEASDVTSQIEISRTLKEIEPLFRAWETYKELSDASNDAVALLDDSDPSMRAMAQEEISSLQEQIDEIVKNFPAVLLPETETDQLSAIIELKAGVGGDEAALFVEEVLRMYMRYAVQKSWKTTILSKTSGGMGTGAGSGLKDVTIEVKGTGAFGDFRFERGVHRVQRVPQTESAGRVHTSTIAVVVLPLSENSNENNMSTDDIVDVKDVKSEVMRSRGAGGQHVNKTESAVRLTHIPTGISVSMQDSRSQHQNRAWAWQILRARLLDQKLAQQVEDRRNTRRSQVKGMDRSDKVRTYNFPQNRITDHRIGLTLSDLRGVMEGEGLEYIVQELREHRQTLRLESLLETGEDLDD